MVSDHSDIEPVHERSFAEMQKIRLHGTNLVANS
jgi:hypothetical protein